MHFVVRENIRGVSQRYIGSTVSRGMNISILHAGFAGAISCMLSVIGENGTVIPVIAGEYMHSEAMQCILSFRLFRGYIQQLSVFCLLEFLRNRIVDTDVFKET
ncbi:hypothetical protein GGD38_005550 [Chitinophagaceae bacterium OAS944]|nr:hypothetical protein [Chitinophagaceae bacterium OAS944]